MQKLLIRNISVLKMSEAQHRAHNSPHLKVVSFSIRETVRDNRQEFRRFASEAAL